MASRRRNRKSHKKGAVSPVTPMNAEMKDFLDAHPELPSPEHQPAKFKFLLETWAYTRKAKNENT